jgi:hypothetical protein
MSGGTNVGGPREMHYAFPISTSSPLPSPWSQPGGGELLLPPFLPLGGEGRFKLRVGGGRERGWVGGWLVFGGVVGRWSPAGWEVFIMLDDTFCYAIYFYVQDDGDGMRR